MKYQKVTISLMYDRIDSKLHAVKSLKEMTGMGLIDAKHIIDSLDKSNTDIYKDKMYVDVPMDIDKQTWTRIFEVANIKIEFNERERKMKRLLYSDQTTLIQAMLSDMGNWEKEVNSTDLENLSYNACKNIAIDKITEKYKEFISDEFFINLNYDINRINQMENKDIGGKFIKFNEEYGEFNAEYLKFLGLTYKDYDKDELLGEMADTLQVLLSIYNQICDETGITISDILNKIKEKNIKWETNIKNYKTNRHD